MSTSAIASKDATADAGGERVDMKLEVITIPVSDLDRARKFYVGLGWGLEPGRIAGGATTYASIHDLAQALRRAEAAHGRHEAKTGQRDANWPDWYAAYMVAEQAGAELPS